MHTFGHHLRVCWHWVSQRLADDVKHETNGNLFYHTVEWRMVRGHWADRERLTCFSFDGIRRIVRPWHRIRLISFSLSLSQLYLVILVIHTLRRWKSCTIARTLTLVGFGSIWFRFWSGWLLDSTIFNVQTLCSCKQRERDWANQMGEISIRILSYWNLWHTKYFNTSSLLNVSSEEWMNICIDYWYGVGVFLLIDWIQIIWMRKPKSTWAEKSNTTNFQENSLWNFTTIVLNTLSRNK